MSKIGRIVHRGFKAIHSRGMILMYHRVVDIDDDPQLLCVKPEAFDAQMKYIKENYNVVRLSELADAVKVKKIPHKSIVITFDDGYSDNSTNAKPILEKYHLPSTVFVTTSMIDKEHGFWWDEIEYLMHTKGDDTYNEVHDKIKSCRLSEQASLITKHSQDSPDGNHNPVTNKQLRELESGGLMEVGAHTVYHTQLASQTLEDQETEICGSKKQLEHVFKHRITSFAYPYGEPHKDYTQNTVELVKHLGFDCAVSNYPRTVTRYTNPYEMPRFIVRDWDTPTFAKNLKEWFYE